MKTLLPMVLASFLLVGCSSDDPSGPGDGSGNSTMSANVQGASWSATNITATWVGSVLGLSGTSANGDRITLTALVTSPGSFDLAESDGAGTFASGSDFWYTVANGGSGTLTVTSINTTGASGTFSFVGAGLEGGAEGTRTVTQGTFNVRFIVSG